MFLGSPANHAAKLASGDESGVYVSDTIREKLNMHNNFIGEVDNRFDESALNGLVLARSATQDLESSSGNITSRVKKILESWTKENSNTNVKPITEACFEFFYKSPPLKNIKYKDLTPSNSIRMPVASIFADLSNFTSYIDKSISEGDIENAVTSLYVIRKEFQNVLELDFNGRKIRFIGDCIHGILATGDKTKVDPIKTIVDTAACAGGLRDSFELCQALLQKTSDLGLSIGVEYGPTPVSRIGIRGDRSVRIASSLATTQSESIQRSCGKNDTKFGHVALSFMPASLKGMLSIKGVITNLRYDDVVDGTLFNHQTFQPSERHAEQRQAVSKQPRAHAENLWTP